jgi:hypothetical protein
LARYHVLDAERRGESMMNWRAALFVWCGALAGAACDEPNDDGNVTEGDDAEDPMTCETQLSEQTCEATNQPGSLCAWVSVQTFSDVDACQVASTEGRCVSLEDIGAGCFWWSCDQTNYYTRVGDAGIELFDFTPDTCGNEPSAEEGWRQCRWSSSGMTEAWSEGQACDCACGSPPSGTEPP